MDDMEIGPGTPTGCRRTQEDALKKSGPQMDGSRTSVPVSEGMVQTGNTAISTRTSYFGKGKHRRRGMTVNDALIRAEKFKDSKSRLDAYPLTHMEADYLFLAAEVRRLRAMLEPTLDARGIVIRAASIANDYIQDLGDQSRSSEILGRSVQKAILNSQELDSYIAAYRVRLLDEAAERIFTSDKRFPHYHQEGEFTICIPVDDACAAVRGEVEK